jgi:hypothetical protein
LKDLGPKDGFNEISVYSYLQGMFAFSWYQPDLWLGKQFACIPPMLGSYTSEDFDVVVVEKVEGEHVEHMTSKE